MIDITTLQLQQPLWLLLIIVPILMQLIKYMLPNNPLPESYFDKKLSKWYLFNRPKYSDYHSLVINYIFWLSLALALAEPVKAVINPQNQTIETGAKIAVVIDVSTSMNAKIHQASRLERARIELLLLIDEIDIGNSLSILLFSGSTHLLLPLTTDKNLMRFYANTIEADMLPYKGSNINQALYQADNLLSAATDTNLKTIVIMTDGDIDSAGEYISELKKNSITSNVIVIGIGNEQEVPIPVLNQSDLWMKHDGSYIYSKLNINHLTQMSQILNSELLILNEQQNKGKKIFKLITSQQKVDTQNPNINYKQEYHPFLLISIFSYFYIYLVNKRYQ